MKTFAFGALLLALVGCSKEPARTAATTTAPGPSPVIETTPKPGPAIEATVTDSSGVRGIKIDGVEIVCAEDVPERASRTSAPESADGVATLLILRGHSIRITGEVLEVDGVRFGGVHSGDKVELRKAGVFVNAATRGPLP